MNESFEYIIESNRGLFKWGELWRYRELFYFFTWRDVKVKYKQTVLGFLWAVLQPVLMMVVFTFFFGRTLNVPSQNLQYPIFVFSGLLLWNMFSAGLSNAATSMVTNSGIIKKIYFPRLIIPASSILVALFDFFMTFIIFVLMLIVYDQHVSLDALWCWPCALLICLLSTMGPGCWLAALNVKYRDFRYVIPFLIQILFFLTPVLYPVSMLKTVALKYILMVSPMYAAIELFRFPLTNIPVDAISITISLLSGVVFNVIGLTYFKRTEDLFADFA